MANTHSYHKESYKYLFIIIIYANHFQTKKFHFKQVYIEAICHLISNEFI